VTAESLAMEPSKENGICNLETNKALGEDGITAELIENASRELKEKRHFLYINIYYTACSITMH